ncbi:NAD(P)-binding domain-containing protein [Bradyrhizobium sp. 160]|uniref:NAD(P)-binding domain-containing protein n=1 Tax=unclassified Bradyrhizobium TaxID=2631580 RepID=UPI001FF96CC8|nr:MULTISPECIES: NAD(P)-binding domain-containing protein [unclassified Bradyrhizobium]MCK1542467.1 NAD(P)-binding domain-containing protein [Bradyrhizobium sp. 179]MCK1623100.1 NAD(P)-binding domain-containing protein [Bradyrhizobium sp. 160]
MEVDVAIIGAGPYGLSLAAHLRAAGVDHRIFGRPMETWRHHMPEGMLLKSDGFASNLYDPAGEYPLSRFCSEYSIKYSDDQTPVRLETFIDYGRAFGDRFSPNLEETTIHSLRRHAEGFAFCLENGTTVRARRIVAATGIGHFRYVPPPLSALTAKVVSHSYDHRDLGRFAGRRVAVVGGGASAIDMAALLKRQECDVTLICRREKLVFANPPPSKRSLWQRIRHPRSGIGPGLKSRLCTDAPLLFHLMPDAFREEVVRRHLGPAAGWPMRQMFVDHVPALCGCEVVEASAVDQGVRLELRRPNGETAWVHADHVIAATGYRVDIRRLDYMDRTLVAQLAHVNQSPMLSMRFESSVKGLFLIGPIAANSFGPMMRFAFGAGFAARRLAPTLRRPSRIELPTGKKLRADAWAGK